MHEFKIFLMANDTKWVECVKEMPSVPFPGMDLTGLAGEQPLKVSGVGYNLDEGRYQLRVNWLSQQPLTSAQLIELNVGWQLVPNQ